MEPINVSTHRDELLGKYAVMAEFSEFMRHTTSSTSLARMVMEKVADAIAAEFLREHAQDVLAAMDQKAIATLAVAESASAIRKTLDQGIGSLERAINRPREIAVEGWLTTRRGTIR